MVTDDEDADLKSDNESIITQESEHEIEEALQPEKELTEEE